MAGRQGLLIRNMGQKLRTVVDPGSVIGVQIGIGNFLHCLWVNILGLFIRFVDTTDGIMYVYPSRGWFGTIDIAIRLVPGFDHLLDVVGQFFPYFSR